METLSLFPCASGSQGIVSIPGSKSLTNRALLLAGLANGKSVLTGVLESDDTKVMHDALISLGVQIEKDGEIWTIHGGDFSAGNKDIYLDNAGTATRFLTAASGLVNGQVRIHGKDRMHKRPIGDLLLALRQLGVDIISEKKNDCPPVITNGKSNIEGGVCEISGKLSSQFLSAILHIAPLTQKGVTLKILPPLVSRPYLEMTIKLLERFGIHVEEISKYEYRVEPQQIQPVTMEIEADASSAAHVFSLAVASRGSVTISNFPKDSLQGDAQFVEVLKKFGAEISSDKNGTTVMQKGEIQPLGEIDMEDMPDVALAAVTLAALANGESYITGLSTLRHKECDRISALSQNLQKMGAHIYEGGSFLKIHGNPKLLRGANIKTFDDHRIAMSFAALGTVVSGVVIEDPKCVEKTFPNFWEVFEKLRG